MPPPHLILSQEQQRKKDRPFTGRSVANGKIRFTSVSQMKTFDPTQYGGCNRKWAFGSVFGKKIGDNKATKTGTDSATSLEHYLKSTEDVLPPLLQGVKKYFPIPRLVDNDLEVERPMAIDILKAIQFREEYLRTMDMSKREVLAGEMRRLAGLIVADIPVDGAADCRHRRGVYQDENGQERPEHPRAIVAETLDLKTIKRINDRKLMKGKNRGMILKGLAKTPAELIKDIQLLGYGVHASDLYPDTTHQRLSHVYAQKESKGWAKRTALISVEEVRRRWHEDVAPIARKMEQVATATNIEDVEPNYNACDDYTYIDAQGEIQFGCGHRAYCPMSQTQVSVSLLGQSKEMNTMSLSLLDMMEDPSAVTAAPPPPQALVAPTAPPVPQDPVAYQAAVDLAKTQLTANEGQTASYGVCPQCGAGLSAHNASRLPNGGLKHLGCTSTVVAAPPPPNIGAVNPPDAPTPNLLQQADPMSADSIAQVGDPVARAQMIEHAAAHAQVNAAAAAEKASGKAKGASWCMTYPPDQKVAITMEQAVAQKFVCSCGKNWTIKKLAPIKGADGNNYTCIPKHKPPKEDEGAETAPVASAGPTMTIVVEQPSAPAAPVVVVAPAPPAPPVAVVTPVAPVAAVAAPVVAAPPPPALVVAPAPPVPPPPPAPVVVAPPTPTVVQMPPAASTNGHANGESTKYVNQLFGSEPVGANLVAVVPLIPSVHNPATASATSIVDITILIDDSNRRFRIERSVLKGIVQLLEAVQLK